MNRSRPTSSPSHRFRRPAPGSEGRSVRVGLHRRIIKIRLLQPPRPSPPNRLGSAFAAPHETDSNARPRRILVETRSTRSEERFMQGFRQKLKIYVAFRGDALFYRPAPHGTPVALPERWFPHDAQGAAAPPPGEPTRDRSGLGIAGVDWKPQRSNEIDRREGRRGWTVAAAGRLSASNRTLRIDSTPPPKESEAVYPSPRFRTRCRAPPVRAALRLPFRRVFRNPPERLFARRWQGGLDWWMPPGGGAPRGIFPGWRNAQVSDAKWRLGRVLRCAERRVRPPHRPAGGMS